MALRGFINLGLNEQEVCDFSEYFLRDWATHASSTTSGDQAGSILSLLEILIAQHATITEHTTYKTCELMRYQPMLPFCGTSYLEQGERQ